MKQKLSNIIHSNFAMIDLPFKTPSWKAWPGTQVSAEGVSVDAFEHSGNNLAR